MSSHVRTCPDMSTHAHALLPKALSCGLCRLLQAASEGIKLSTATLVNFLNQRRQFDPSGVRHQGADACSVRSEDSERAVDDGEGAGGAEADGHDGRAQLHARDSSMGMSAHRAHRAHASRSSLRGDRRERRQAAGISTCSSSRRLPRAHLGRARRRRTAEEDRHDERPREECAD